MFCVCLCGSALRIKKFTAGVVDFLMGRDVVLSCDLTNRGRGSKVLIILEPLYMSKTTVHEYKFPVRWITIASNLMLATISGIKKSPFPAYLAPFHAPPLPSPHFTPPPGRSPSTPNYSHTNTAEI